LIRLIENPRTMSPKMNAMTAPTVLP